MELVIRRARRSDERGVRAVVRTLWGGHDRVPALFDRWVTHRTGPFFVAEVAGRVVGMGKLTVVTRRECWLEGGRVAPRWRRRGIASALIAHRLEYARERGFAVARFSTAGDNTPIHRAARRFGFRRARELARYEGSARAGRLPRRAGAADIPRVLRLLGPYVRVGTGWEWRRITRADVSSAIARGRVFVAGAPSARAAALVARAREASLPVIALGGTGPALGELLASVRAVAAAAKLDDVSLYAPDAATRRSAARSGYTRPWLGMVFLYEKSLTPGDGSARERNTSRRRTARRR